MTKREFDNSKENFGGPIASDTVARYAARRMASNGQDFIARRAAFGGTLELGTKWRNVARFRANTGRPMLG